MNESFIYIVGQPDLKSGTIPTIRSLGYKPGLLRDARLKNTYSDAFDRVIDIDFSQLDEELSKLDSLNISAAGFVCTYENYIIAKSKISHHFNTYSIPTRSAEICTDKLLMRQSFMKTSSSISPAFSVIDHPSTALSFAKKHGYPVIIKPTGLVKSLLVMRCNSPQELEENVLYALDNIEPLYQRYRIYDRKPQLIIEEYMDGEQFSVASFVDNQGNPHFSEGVVSLTTAQDLGVDDTYLYKRQLPAGIDPALRDEMLRISSLGIKALDMKSTAAHIELMNTPSGVKIIEIGARIGGYRPRMYNYSYGIDMIKQDVRLSVGLKPELKGKLSKHCAVYEIFPDEEGVFTGMRGSLDLEQLAYYKEVPHGSSIGPAKRGYKAAAIAIVTSQSAASFHRLCKKIETLSIEVSS